MAATRLKGQPDISARSVWYHACCRLEGGLYSSSEPGLPSGCLEGACCSGLCFPAAHCADRAFRQAAHLHQEAEAADRRAMMYSTLLQKQGRWATHICAYILHSCQAGLFQPAGRCAWLSTSATIPSQLLI